MRITLCLGPHFPVPPVMGGAVERAQLALAEEFAAKGHLVTLISRQYNDFQVDEIRCGVHHLRVKSCDAPSSRLAYRLHDLVYCRRVARVLPESDVTVTNSVLMPLLLPMGRAGCLYVHAARFPKHQMWLYQHAARIQTPSTAIADEIIRQTPKLREKVISIPYPLVGPLAGLSSYASLSERPSVILYVGRIAKEKGLGLLIEAFIRASARGLKHYRLLIVGPHETRHGGDGVDYLSHLKTLAIPSNGTITFSGPIFDICRLRKAYESADIFVYPSLADRGETFGLAPLEAMAAGCRVVVSDLKCFEDYLRPGENGLQFCRQGDPVSALAAALIIMDKESDKCRMRIAAVSTASQFQVQPIAERFIADFKAITSIRAGHT